MNNTVVIKNSVIQELLDRSKYQCEFFWTKNLEGKCIMLLVEYHFEKEADVKEIRDFGVHSGAPVHGLYTTEITADVTVNDNTFHNAWMHMNIDTITDESDCVLYLQTNMPGLLEFGDSIGVE